MIGICSLEDDVDTLAVPLMEEFAKYEPDMNVAITVSKPGEGSYAESINDLAKVWKELYPDDTWFIPMNPDVELGGPIQDRLDKMPTDKLYGLTINEKFDLQWIDGWIYFISQEVWEKVGPFDEKFKIACFEDADYTWTAQKAGVGIAKVTMPMKHHRASPRMRVPNFWKVRKDNQSYLSRKWNLGKEWSYR